jgi:hypothetical protein
MPKIQGNFSKLEPERSENRRGGVTTSRPANFTGFVALGGVAGKWEGSVVGRNSVIWKGGGPRSKFRPPPSWGAKPYGHKLPYSNFGLPPDSGISQPCLPEQSSTFGTGSSGFSMPMLKSWICHHALAPHRQRYTTTDAVEMSSISVLHAKCVRRPEVWNRHLGSPAYCINSFVIPPRQACTKSSVVEPFNACFSPMYEV